MGEAVSRAGGELSSSALPAPPPASSACRQPPHIAPKRPAAPLRSPVPTCWPLLLLFRPAQGQGGEGFRRAGSGTAWPQPQQQAARRNVHRWACSTMSKRLNGRRSSAGSRCSVGRAGGPSGRRKTPHSPYEPSRCSPRWQWRQGVRRANRASPTLTVGARRRAQCGTYTISTLGSGSRVTGGMKRVHSAAEKLHSWPFHLPNL